MNELQTAANQAIFQFQLPTTQAVKFVESQVKDFSKEQIIEALTQAMTFHKSD